MNKLITTYKEHKEKPNEPVQGLGRSLAYSGLNYIFGLLKNDETYQEELEDSIVGIEAYINEREEEIERLTKNLKQGIEYCKELMLFKKNSRQYLIGKCMLEKLGGANIWLEEKFNVGVDKE